jgi:hypothetical protein
MHWKLKASIQNGIALLPSSLSYEVYYRMQRLVGGLRHVDPIEHLTAGIETWRRIQQQGQDPRGKVFFEVGTGRVPEVPLACWLMGAERTITVDVNPYIKSDLVLATLREIDARRAEIEALFGGLLLRDRFERLLQLAKGSAFDVQEFLQMCAIDYVVPADAGNTHLPPNSVDYHVSYTVFEHIPGDVLYRILVEGKRIVQQDGLFVHMVDYSDHFSHSDSRVSPINFLQFSDAEWDRFAGNRYMYANRLRHDDVLAIFEAAGHHCLVVEPLHDEEARQLLTAGTLKLDPRFAGKSIDTLSIRESWIVSTAGPVQATRNHERGSRESERLTLSRS